MRPVSGACSHRSPRRAGYSRPGGGVAWTAPGTQTGLYSEAPETPRPSSQTMAPIFQKRRWRSREWALGSASMPRPPLAPQPLSHGGASVPFITPLGQQIQRGNSLCLCNEITGWGTEIEISLQSFQNLPSAFPPL